MNVDTTLTNISNGLEFTSGNILEEFCNVDCEYKMSFLDNFLFQILIVISGVFFLRLFSMLHAKVADFLTKFMIFSLQLF